MRYIIKPGRCTRFVLLATLVPMVNSLSQANAQEPPDAGQIFQETQPQPALPEPRPSFTIGGPKTDIPATGGPQVALREIELAGNEIFTNEELLASLGDYQGKSFDFAGLYQLAQQISDYYQEAGYLFARAYLPMQSLQEGRLRIQIVEGRYGEVQAIGDERLAHKAQSFLQPLKRGDIIASDLLERATQLLSDQPGIGITPIIRPGQEVGTGDLLVEVNKTVPYRASVGVDNAGNRYTGQTRLLGNLDINSPFQLGDQVGLRVLYTEENLWLGQLAYNMPLGAKGLRGQFSYARTEYELGKEFESLEAIGTVDVLSAGLSYPLIRSQRLNLTLSGAAKLKKLRDRQDATATQATKSGTSFPLSLNFDRRDSFAGGGLSYGTLTWTHGDIDPKDALAKSNAEAGRTEGNFDKLNLDLARLQSLTANWTLFGRMSGQLASGNLDSSEDFGLGGVYGVRAYPSGEGYGDEGWLAQLEMRYSWNDFSPYVFYDQGEVTLNKSRLETATNHRRVIGTGAGVRFSREHWTAELILAWRLHGGAPESDPRKDQPLIWGSAAYLF